MIDLRSDTVTKPTPEMRQAMFAAEVGDDVYQEDPTVNELERRAALAVGKEAALFVPTGTMGNTIALKLHTEHGQEIICDARSHILNYELSMMAWFAGCVGRAIPTPDGLLTWETIRAEIRPLGPHAAPTGLIEIENSHNLAGGTVYPLETIREIAHEAHKRNLPVHMDGARIFNAALAGGHTAAEVAAPVDSVMFCLSKGLGAPAGSMLAGTREAIDRGRRLRKRLGGGMRQAGILAAAGLIALEEMPARLAADHANAKWLATRIAALPGVSLDPCKVQTNIVIFDVSGTGWTAPAFSAALKARGVLMNSFNDRDIRLVTHYDVESGSCEAAFDAIREVSAAPPKTQTEVVFVAQ
jgi:threonine aldolase